MSTELEKLEIAIADLRDGKRVGRVTVNGKTIEYSDVTLDELLKLRDSLILRAGNRSIRVGYPQGGKGLC